MARKRQRQRNPRGAGGLVTWGILGGVAYVAYKRWKESQGTPGGVPGVYCPNPGTPEGYIGVPIRWSFTKCCFINESNDCVTLKAPCVQPPLPTGAQEGDFLFDFGRCCYTRRDTGTCLPRATNVGPPMAGTVFPFHWSSDKNCYVDQNGNCGNW